MANMENGVPDDFWNTIRTAGNLGEDAREFCCIAIARLAADYRLGVKRTTVTSATFSNIERAKANAQRTQIWLNLLDKSQEVTWADTSSEDDVQSNQVSLDHFAAVLADLQKFLGAAESRLKAAKLNAREPLYSLMLGLIWVLAEASGQDLPTTRREQARGPRFRTFLDECLKVIAGHGINDAESHDALDRVNKTISEAFDRDEWLELRAPHDDEVHRRTYPRFWEWSQNSVDAAKLSGFMTTMFGWRRRVKAGDRATSLMNFPMQAHGAEMMRIAAIAATEAGIRVCAPVHDAFFIVAPANEIDEQTAAMRNIMQEAGATITGGLPIRTDAKVIRCPDRYMDPQGIPMWNKVVGLAGFASAQIDRIA